MGVIPPPSGYAEGSVGSVYRITGPDQAGRPRCGLSHPILRYNIFFYVELFAAIILSQYLLNCIVWYLRKLPDSLFGDENSVFPILKEKNLK